MNRIAIIPNTIKKGWRENTARLCDILRPMGVSVIVDERWRGELGDKAGVEWLSEQELWESAQMAITLGGDGTLINAAKRAVLYDVPLLGVNLGTLGFMVELELNDDYKYYQRLVDNCFNYDIRMMFDIEARRGSRVMASALALNECLVARGDNARMIALSVSCDGTDITSYWGDGVIVATPTGSTGYSLSAGGPIVEPQAENFLITPVCAHSIGKRPIVMSQHGSINVTVGDISGKEAILSCDGETVCSLRGGDVVSVRRSPYSTRLIRMKNRGFYDILNLKLNERGPRI